MKKIKLKKWMRIALSEEGCSIPETIESISSEELQDNFECHYNYHYPSIADFREAVANDYYEYPNPKGDGAIFTQGFGEPFHVHDW